MTVGYLMDHISFDEMVPHLISMIRDPEKDLYSIREDFDLIRYFEANSCMDELVHISRRENGQLHVDGLHDLEWVDAKGMEIQYEGVYDAPLSLVAASCLVEMLFYGCIGPRYYYADEGQTIEFPDGPFYHLYSKWSDKIIPFQYFLVPMNGPKRKKRNRWVCRNNYLHMFAEREDLIHQMSKAFPNSLLRFLVLEMQHGYVYEYHSRLATGDERLHYILQSITVYQKIDTLRYDGAFFWVTVPRNHPWSDQKWKEFQQDLRVRFQLPIQFGIIWNERRREEITGNMLLYKRADHPLYPKWNRGKFKEDDPENPTFLLITNV